jgi:hypothetical protein
MMENRVLDDKRDGAKAELYWLFQVREGMNPSPTCSLYYIT